MHPDLLNPLYRLTIYPYAIRPVFVSFNALSYATFQSTACRNDLWSNPALCVVFLALKQVAWNPAITITSAHSRVEIVVKLWRHTCGLGF